MERIALKLDESEGEFSSDGEFSDIESEKKRGFGYQVLGENKD